MCLQKNINPIGKEVEAGWLDQNRFLNLTDMDTTSCDIFLFLPKEQGSRSRRGRALPVVCYSREQPLLSDWGQVTGRSGDREGWCLGP